MGGEQKGLRANLNVQPKNLVGRERKKISVLVFNLALKNRTKHKVFSCMKWGVDYLLGRGCESNIQDTIVLIKALVAFFQEVGTRILESFGESGHGLAWGRVSLQAVAPTRGDLWERENGRQPRGQLGTCVAGCRRIRRQMTRQNREEEL